MTFRRSPTAPHLPSQADWPIREQALAIIAALDRLEEGTSTELDRLTGIPDAQTVAHRCYQVFGYPEHEGVTFARRMAEVFMRPREGHRGAEGAAGGIVRGIAIPADKADGGT